MGDFLQIHSLVSYPGVLLNRDDVGLAKRLPFGDAVRIRVSSQCLKKHWREAVAARHPQLKPAVRSREIFGIKIRDWLLEQEGVSDLDADRAAKAVAAAVLRSAAKEDEGATDGEAPSAGPAGGESLASGQVIVLTSGEIDRLREVALRIAREGVKQGDDAGEGSTKKGPKKSAKGSQAALTKEEQAELGAMAGAFDTALFGRFVTSDLLGRVDAAASVAHAFTVHAEQAEADYFTAVDMLTADSGAAMVGDAELTSGLFYVYVVIDLQKLEENLGPQAGITAELAGWLVEAIATTSPGAKRGSTAPYAWSEFMLLERGQAQPRTLANAFRRALPVQAGRDVLADAAQALLEERARLADMYGDLAALEHAVVSTTLRDVKDVPTMPLHEAIKRVLAA
jgi:CRISPR system Cascade subunit CasC